MYQDKYWWLISWNSQIVHTRKVQKEKQHIHNTTTHKKAVEDNKLLGKKIYRNNNIHCKYKISIQNQSQFSEKSSWKNVFEQTSIPPLLVLAFYIHFSIQNSIEFRGSLQVKVWQLLSLLKKDLLLLYLCWTKHYHVDQTVKSTCTFIPCTWA